MSALADAARRADADAVRAALTETRDAADAPDVSEALWLACDSDAPAAERLAVTELLLDAGASPRRFSAAHELPLHAAARRGPVALAELLIRRGALSWQADAHGHDALAHARAGTAPDRDALIALLDRPVITDPHFRAAVAALHAGDAAALAQLLAAHPTLLTEPAREPDCYPRDYFRDPMLAWFVANNPTLMREPPANLPALVAVLAAHGAAKRDLDYALALALSGNALGALQIPVAEALLAAGATASRSAITAALGHRERAPIAHLLSHGTALTAPIAAALGRTGDLPALLAAAAADEVQEAFGLAVINRQFVAARLCLDAGARVDAPLPVHAHSTAAHQAALDDDVPMLELLVERGAPLDRRDTLWDGTPLGWARHGGAERAIAFLTTRNN